MNGTTGFSLAMNDDWEESNGVAIATAAREVGTFPMTAGAFDSALLAPLADGMYTPQVTDRHGGTGLALVEIYELP